MELYAKGQLSFLILNCLLERDFYGLDIISEIRERSNGRINLKKPSVYSNLTRMEKQNFVSAYLKSSDLGPNRKYYSITEKGRGFFAELKEYFDRNNVNVFRDFSDEDAQEKAENVSMFDTYQPQVSPSIEENQQQTEQVDAQQNDEGQVVDDNDYFDFSLVDEENNNVEENNEQQPAIQENINEINQSNFDSFIHENNANNIVIEEHEDESSVQQVAIDEELTNVQEERVDDGVFLSIASDNSEEKQPAENGDFNVNEEENLVEEDAVATEDKTSALSSFASQTSEIKEEESKEDVRKDDAVFLSNENVVDNASESFSFASQETEIKEEPKEDTVKDDAVFLSDGNATEYNKKLYDISKDINKYKKKKSFAEDQIAITVDSPLYLSNEKTKANVEEFKNTFTENVNKVQTETIKPYDFSRQFNRRESQNTFIETKAVKVEEPVKDDAKYITGRIDSVERARKIEPPRLKLNEAPARENKLPAPKRDTSIDPSHKEILSRLYSKTKDNVAENVREDAIYDYSDLKDFYNGQNIEFNEYKRPEKKYHNTNKLYFILSLISFLSVAVASAILYVILLKTNQLFDTLNFLYIVLPAIVIVDVVWKLYNFKKFSGWLPDQITPQWKIWGNTILLACVIVLINIVFGLGYKSFDNYSTTLLLPLVMVVLLVPVRYYLKRFMLVRFWR